MPLLASTYGVMPWHVDDMPRGEVEVFLDHLSRTLAQQRNG